MKPRYSSPLLFKNPLEHKILKLFCILILPALLTAASVNAASVFTDREDYPPEDTVHITGTGFQADETVTVQVEHLDGLTPIGEPYEPWDVQANSYGIFDTYWVVPEDALAETLLVTAEGQSSGITATAIFSDNNTLFMLNTVLNDTLCPGSVEYCVTLYQSCPGGEYVPLPGRPILFFVNYGNCGVDVGQSADDTVLTDSSGQACASLTLPDSLGAYSLRAKFLGESKPGPSDPPNSACDPSAKVNLSAANLCNVYIADSSACNLPPVATCPGDTTVFLCDLTDVCISGFMCSDPDGNLESCEVSPGYLSGDQVCFTPTGSGAYTLTLIATDSAGLADTCQTVVTVVLNNPPGITCPADLTIECSASTDPSNTGYPTVTDDHDPSPSVSYVDSETAGSCPQEKVITRTWIAVDECNDSSQCQQTITVVDDTAPVISCPSNITIECDASTDPSNTGTATATDNCDPTPSIGYSDQQSGDVITREWVATDDCGNADTCFQTITLEDTTPPEITCPSNVTIECDESTDPSNTGTATATDNCDQSPVITYSDSVAAGSCDQESVIYRKWTATDADNNSDDCVQVITVVDTTAPQITCPSNITIECDESTDPSNTGSATATDNCDPSPVITYSDQSSNGTITREWVATDDCGNADTCYQTITTVDTTPPEITCPSNVTIECDESTDPSNTGTATATDNCDATPVITYSDSVAAGSCDQESFIHRKWTATDEHSNSASCVQVITVVDTTPPQITCPSNITIECDESTDPSNTGTATATDNCDPTPVITYSDQQSGDVITRMWTAADDCGNADTCYQTITIVDTTPPEITCPSNITIECDASTDPSNTGTATATDNCDATPVITYSDSVAAGSCAQESVIYRKWTATDADNNSDDCVQVITVVDTTAPQITCPSNITIECDESTDPSNTGSATATDICDPSPVITYFDQSSNGTITREWVATDDCGNADTCYQTITTVDTTPPEITCPSNVTIECDESTDPSNTGTATATDNCDDTPVITYTDSVAAGSCDQESFIHRKWTATDEHSNSASCVQVITVVDTTPPQITCPSNITIECDESTDPSSTGTATATDNCDPTPSIGYQDSIVAGSCPQEETIYRKWTAADDCNNSTVCTQVISVVDDTPPVITCPGDITVECDQSIDPVYTGSASADDNCDADPTIGYRDSVEAGSCPQEETIYRIWTATDDCGNSDECIQVISVVDTTPPVVDCPSDITIECDESTDPSNTGTATATDNCDPSPTVTYRDESDKGVISRFWVGEDACGNKDSCVQTITTIDTTPPDITCPPNLTIECDDPSDPQNTGWATATDNCDPDPEVTYFDTTVAGDCPQEYTIYRNWTATDDHDNSDGCQQIITVVDTTVPVISCPPDAGVECNDPTDPSHTGTATATDNCDPNPGISYQDDASPTGINRIWYATDACGNYDSCIQVITIAENNPPVATCHGNFSASLCDLSETMWIHGFSCSDPDGNLATCEAVGGVLDGDSVAITPVEGENIIKLTATDECGETDVCSTIVTVELNQPPVAECPSDVEVFQCELDSICIQGFSCEDPDGNLISCTVNKGELTGNTVCFMPSEGVNTLILTATDNCGATDVCTTLVNVTVNQPPTVTCPPDTTIYVTGLPIEVCVDGFYCDDPEDNLISCEVDLGQLVGDTVCFTAYETGVYTITLTATDECGDARATASGITRVYVLDVCPMVKIETTHNSYQGHYEDVSIFLEHASYDVEGFDFLIAYDASALTASSVIQGELLDTCNWEYFTYRFGPQGNCDGGCPSGMIRIVALAEMNDGYPGSTCLGPPDTDPHELARIRFYVSNDRTLECQFVPIRFFWYDCGDNSISSNGGEILYIDSKIYDYLDNLIWDEDDDDEFPEDARIPFVGAPDFCLNPDPLKPTAVRCIDFFYGGINIICADSIDDPGDINLNGVPNEISDAVVFTNYFVYGLAAFEKNVEGQIAATDVNKDGNTLTVADLVYMIRIIVGDAQPLPKTAPDISALFVTEAGIVKTDSEIGAACIVLEGEVDVALGRDAAHMDLMSAFDGTYTNVLIYSFGKGETCLGEILVADGRIISVDAADYFGNAYRTGLTPAGFSVRCYPNPFNPIATIEFTLPVSSDWEVMIYNVTGQKVAGFEGFNESGLVTVKWDASSHSSGVYFYKVAAGQNTVTRKMVLLK